MPKKVKKNTSNVSVSAAITSKARIKLYRGMIEVMKNKGRILRTDTDSIIAAFNKKEIQNVIDKPLGEVYFDSNKKILS